LQCDTAADDADECPASPPLTPEVLAPHFPQLEIIEWLGRGGMGVVYKARQKSLNRFVALKLLAPERVTDRQFAERFAHEARALAALSHPTSSPEEISRYRNIRNGTRGLPIVRRIDDDFFPPVPP
jgi:serine/threonine protein kinase